jgi:predicted nucleic acid-binding protein
MTTLVDTNILIYHTTGSQIATSFLARLLRQQALHISILTKIEFPGWDKHTPEGFEKCRRLIKNAHLYPVEEDISNKAVELKRRAPIKLADSVIAATALLNNLTLATRNKEDFKGIDGLEIINPFEG